MKRSTALGAAAFSLALAGGATAGALLGTPAVSGAQDDTTTTVVPDEDHEKPDHPLRERRGERLSAAAEALGMSEDELRDELHDGRSIAAVAEARGVEVQVVVDALVAAATEQLEAAIDELPERMAEVVQREGPPHGRGHRWHPGGRPGERGPWGPGTEDGPADDGATGS